MASTLEEGGLGSRPPSEDGSRLGGGFDFLLYQKKAGLQDAADQAAKDVAKEEEKAADSGPVEQVKMQREINLDKRRPPGPMYLSWKQMEDEEFDRLKKAGIGDNPCKDDFYLRMRHRLMELYKNHLYPLEVATPFKDLYDDPLDDGDFTAMPFIMVIVQPGLYKEKFLEKFLDDAYVIRDPKRRFEEVGDRTTGGFDQETSDRLGGGFDFLLYQKKAGLQDAADQAAKEVEKSEEAAAGPVDTGPVKISGPKEVRSRLVVWKDKFVFVVTLDQCFGAPGSCRDYRAEDAEREIRLKEEAEEKKKEEERKKKKKEMKEKKQKAEEAKKKAEAALYDPFGLGWKKPDDAPGGKADAAGKKGARKKGGFDFLLFQKKAGLQEAAQEAEKEANKDAGADQQQATTMEYLDDDGSEDFIEVDEFLPGRDVLKTVPRIMNFGGIISKLGASFVHDHLRGYQTDSYTLTKFNCLMCPDVPDTIDTPEPGGYCYEAAIRFFGMKADRIFVVADMRRDMTNKFASTLEAVRSFHGKISVIYMYPEDVGLPYLIDRYSFCTWNLAKILKDRPDPPRFYGNIFRDAAGLDRCLYHADQEMYHELYYIDKFSNLRLAYEIQRRSMLAAILGTLQNDLKASMPKLRLPFKVPKSIRLNIPGMKECLTIPIINRTERAKREALYSLDYRFYSLQETERLPLNYFPNPDHLADVLVYKDLDKLDWISKEWIHNARGIAEEDCVRILSRLRESYPSHVLDFDPECSIMCGKEDFGYVVSKRDQTSFDTAFDALGGTPYRPNRYGGGFDFLLYQKKAGLQDAADQAAKEVEQAEEAPVDTGPVQSGPRQKVNYKVTTRKPVIPVHLSAMLEDMIDSETVIEALMPLNLPPGAVCRIAYLADVDRDGKLAREEFYTAMHLALRKLHGLELPMKLPIRMEPCLRRKKRTETAYRRMTELGAEELPKLFYPEEHPPPLCPTIPPPPPPPPPKEKPKSMFPDWGSMFGPPPRRKIKPGTIDSMLDGGDHIWQLFASAKKKYRDVRIQEDLLTFGGWRATGSMSHFFSFL
ncbi:unnamed protein product [Notodromas monacha]|uniref:EH domain-containing protein n=1 Tax=Notodromas monacha TaxID=399045 RepID=A0A7R9BE28_9CRUS|nr:unnamed protein product [Notodromas monacha]CAG0913097.1 unnamed protein product [Notodromas monacha]